MAAALAGIRALDLTTTYAAYAGRLLADLGADVVRIEPPEGSPVRRLAPCRPGPSGECFSFAHAFLDAGKRSVTLDLATDGGRAQLASLAATSDVVIAPPSALNFLFGRIFYGTPVSTFPENALPDVDLAAIRRRDPALVLVSISPFGRDGPYADHAATDLTLLAAGGLLSLGGYADGAPLAVHGEQAMLACGIFAAVAALAALYERAHTGKGQWIDLSGQECVAFALEDAVAEWDIHARVRRRHGDGAREAGTGVYPCRDGHVSLVAGRLGTAAAFVALTKWIAASDAPGAASLLEPQWQDFAFRQSRAGIDRFAAIFGAFCRTRGKQELYREGQARRIAIAPVSTIADVLADVQLHANSYFQRQLAPALGRDVVFPGAPFRLSRTPARLRGPAPALGAHNGELLHGGFRRKPAADLIRHRLAAESTSNAKTTPQLTGMRVLDFCWIGAGAFVTRILADLGAEVIKVESRSHPDNLRLSPPHRPGAAPLESSGYFASRNTSKKSLALDMSHPRARDIALRLAARCSIVSNNFRPGVMERWGLGYREVAAVNPAVIYLAMPMQGSAGPHRDYIGFGSTIAALCGLVSMAGVPGRAPIGTGTHYPDHVPNPGHALVAVLAAAFHRARTGEGQYIEVAQIESTVSMLGPSLLAYSATGALPPVDGNRLPGAVPRGVFPCADEDSWCAIEVNDDRQWQGLVTALGAPAWMCEKDLMTVAGRELRQGEIESMLARETKRRAARDLVRVLQAHGVAAAVVATSADVTQDPQLAARGYWHRVAHAEMGAVLVNLPPFRGVGEGRPAPGPPPLLGEHTVEIASELGFDAAECRRLIEEKVFY